MNMYEHQSKADVLGGTFLYSYLITHVHANQLMTLSELLINTNEINSTYYESNLIISTWSQNKPFHHLTEKLNYKQHQQQ